MKFRALTRGAVVASFAIAAGLLAANAEVLLPLIPGQIAAPIAEEDYPVLSRPRPEYDAIGIPVGGFLLFPALTLAESYDDNVFRTPSNTLGDYFFTIAPSFKLLSQWTQHMLEFYGGLDDFQYVKYTGENLADGKFGADGRYDITGGNAVYADGSIAEEHEALSSPNRIGFQKSPVRYFDDHGEVDGIFQLIRLGAMVGAIVDRYDYLNTPLIGGGLENNADRKFDEYQPYAKAFFNFSPGYSGFLRATYDSRQFDLSLDRTGVNRSSTGYRLDGGVDVPITQLISGEVYVGYLDQTYSRPLKNINGLDYSIKLDWLATPLLTVHLLGSRSLNQVILAGASAEDSKSIGLSADYEFLRNLIFQAHATYVDSAYPGITRNDVTPDLGIGAKYLITRNLSADLTYDHTDRTTNIPGADFQDDTITVGLTIRE